MKSNSYALIVDGVVVNTIVATASYIMKQEGEWVELSKQKQASPGFIKVDSDFVPPKPFDDWKLEDKKWVAPVKEPKGENHQWDERNKEWIKIERTKK